MRDLTPEKLAELRRLAEAATPGPWFWWGNTDSHSVALCGRQPGLGVCEVISTLSVERSTTGRESDRLRRDLAEYTDMSLSDIEEAVEEWATDEYDQPRIDQRLSVTDENYIRRTAEELAVYEVARAQGLPDDTPRGHERIYRADVCDLRATNARYLAAANPAVVLALLDAAAERDALAESVRAYGRTIDRWGLLIIAATHSEDITTPDGDGDWEVIESRLAEVPALLAERDALAAKLAAVREWIDHRGVNVGDRDDDYMRGYRDAQRHALHDANELRALLDATPETGGES